MGQKDAASPDCRSGNPGCKKPGSCPQLDRPDRANQLTLPKMGTRWCSHMENMSMSLTITISSWSSSKMASFSTSVETEAAPWQHRQRSAVDGDLHPFTHVSISGCSWTC